MLLSLSLSLTDPQDLGQLRFSHLLRAKACEGVLKQARASDTGVREPPGALKKKTKWGAAFLEFLDRSESALLHLDYYPVYLQLNHVLGTKVVEAVMTKCIDVFKGAPAPPLRVRVRVRVRVRFNVP
jgi:hypothetical protein